MKILDYMSGLDLFVFAAYMIALVGIGIFVGKRVKNARDFTSANQSLSWKMVAGSTIATCMGAYSVISKYDVIYESGVSGLIAGLFWWVGWLALFPMIRRLRSSNATSIPGFLEKRYNARTRKICSYCVLVIAISTCAGNLLTMGTILNTLGVCSIETGTWIVAIAVVLFTIVSGLWGVAMTDSIQTIFILIGFGFVFPLAVIKEAGSLNFLAEAFSADQIAATQMAPITLIGWAVYYTFAVGADPVYSQRIFNARSVKDAYIGQGVAWAATLIISGLITAIPGFAIGTIFPDLTAGNQFTPLFIATYFPPIIKGLLIAALFSLMITTADTYLLLIASTVMDDLVIPAFPKLPEHTKLNISRIICAASAVVLCFMALYVDTIYELFKIGGGAYGAGVFFPLVLGCFWKKAKAKAINLAMLVGCFFSFAFDMFLKVPLHWDIDGCVIGAILCLIICSVGSILSKDGPHDLSAASSR